MPTISSSTNTSIQDDGYPGLNSASYSLGLLFAAYAVVAWLVSWLAPESVNLPFIGEITWIKNLLSWGSVLLIMVLSVFLMVPVASAFTSLFLDDVADAVEARH